MGGALSSIVQTLIAVAIAWVVGRASPIGFLPAFILLAGALVLAGLLRSCGDWWASGEADSGARRALSLGFRLLIGAIAVTFALIAALRYGGAPP